MTIRRAFRALSPRHRRWAKLLAGLTLDPVALPRPLPPPGPNDFIVCGSPRTGTALLVAMLFQPPRAVCVMEPWDGLSLLPAELFTSLRAELEDGVLRRGRLDVGALRSSGAVRWCRDGERPVDVEMDGGYALGVKFPTFWQYLDVLPQTRFLVCVRDPRDTVASYAATGGRLAAGLDYDVPFNRVMNEHLLGVTDDPALRRVLMYDYINQRILPHLDRPNVMVVRYERWFEDPRALLDEVGAFLEVRLPDVPAVIRSRPVSDPGMHDELIRRHCTTAPALGYG